MYRRDEKITPWPEPGVSTDRLPSTATTMIPTDPYFVASAHAPLIMGTQDTAIAIVIAVLCLVIIGMIAAIVCVYAKRRRKKRILDHSMAAAIADLQDNSIDNPMYGGMRMEYIVNDVFLFFPYKLHGRVRFARVGVRSNIKASQFTPFPHTEQKEN